jgi:hypothetical protein
VVLESGIVCGQRDPFVAEASMSLLRRIPEAKSQEGRFFRWLSLDGELLEQKTVGIEHEPRQNPTEPLELVVHL